MEFALYLMARASVNLPAVTCPRPLLGGKKAFINNSLLSCFAFSPLHEINFRNAFLFPVSGSLIHVGLFEYNTEGEKKINISSCVLHWCHNQFNGGYQSNQINYSVFGWQKGVWESREKLRRYTRVHFHVMMCTQSLSLHVSVRYRTTTRGLTNWSI